MGARGGMEKGGMKGVGEREGQRRESGTYKGGSHCVQVFPRPLSAIHLPVQFICHDAFSITVVQMGQIHCTENNTQ